MVSDRVVERTKTFEGFRSTPYQDTVGKWTVGYGRNLEDNPLSLAEVLSLFSRVSWRSQKDAEDWADILIRRDLKEVERGLVNTIPLYPGLDSEVRFVLLDLGFNVGLPSLRSFKRMLAAIDSGDRDEAAVELLDSKYTLQVKTRAVANGKMLCNDWSKVKEELKQRNPQAFEVVEKYD